MAGHNPRRSKNFVSLYIRQEISERSVRPLFFFVCDSRQDKVRGKVTKTYVTKRAGKGHKGDRKDNWNLVVRWLSMLSLSGLDRPVKRSTPGGAKGP